MLQRKDASGVRTFWYTGLHIWRPKYFEPNYQVLHILKFYPWDNWREIQESNEHTKRPSDNTLQMCQPWLTKAR